MKMLVVEDDDSLIHENSAVFREEGFVIHESKCGDEGIFGSESMDEMSPFFFRKFAETFF